MWKLGAENGALRKDIRFLHLFSPSNEEGERSPLTDANESLYSNFWPVGCLLPVRWHGAASAVAQCPRAGPLCTPADICEPGCSAGMLRWLLLAAEMMLGRGVLSTRGGFLFACVGLIAKFWVDFCEKLIVDADGLRKD